METRILSVGHLLKLRTVARVWLIEIRPKFLVVSVALAITGTSIAWRGGFFSLRYAVLGFIGLILWQISMHLLNDYFDYRSGEDLKTQRTPFSGGSGILPAQLLRARDVLKLGLLSFALAAPIWSYFVITKGLLLLPLLLVGAACVFLYTPVLTKCGLGEITSGLGMGVLPILMFYFIQSGKYTTEAVVAAISSGILLFDTSLLVEFPDVEADRIVGRKNLPIILGRGRAGSIYLVGILVVYAWVVGWVAAGVMPRAVLLSLLPMPLALRAMRGALSYGDGTSFSTALWANALYLLFTIALLGAGYLVSRF